jgi:hypothetical protein
MQAQILQKQKCSDTLVSIGERVVLDDEVQKVRGARVRVYLRTISSTARPWALTTCSVGVIVYAFGMNCLSDGGRGQLQGRFDATAAHDQRGAGSCSACRLQGLVAE